MKRTHAVMISLIMLASFGGNIANAMEGSAVSGQEAQLKLKTGNKRYVNGTLFQEGCYP